MVKTKDGYKIGVYKRCARYLIRRSRQVANRKAFMDKYGPQRIRVLNGATGSSHSHAYVPGHGMIPEYKYNEVKARCTGPWGFDYRGRRCW